MYSEHCSNPEEKSPDVSVLCPEHCSNPDEKSSDVSVLCPEHSSNPEEKSSDVSVCILNTVLTMKRNARNVSVLF